MCLAAPEHLACSFCREGEAGRGISGLRIRGACEGHPAGSSQLFWDPVRCTQESPASQGKGWVPGCVTPRGRQSFLPADTYCPGAPYAVGPLSGGEAVVGGRVPGAVGSQNRVGLCEPQASDPGGWTKRSAAWRAEPLAQALALLQPAVWSWTRCLTALGLHGPIKHGCPWFKRFLGNVSFGENVGKSVPGCERVRGEQFVGP